MTTKPTFASWTAALAMLLTFPGAVAAAPAGAPLARPTPEQAAWQDLELGMFIHYDMPVFKPGWDHRQYDRRPEPGIFNPRKLDTDQWMEAARALGAKYAVFVAKHGSGFMSWQSDLYPYGMKQSPYKDGQGDMVRDFVNSARKYGIRPGIYAHMGCNGFLEVDNPGLVNRGKGGDPEKQARYARTCEGMLTELWGNYGELTEIWFDGGVLDPEKGGPDMLPILRRLQPKAIVFQGPAASIRWIGNEDGVAPYPCWATAPAERDYNGPGVPGGPRWLPGECDVPVRSGVWIWEPNTEGRLLSVDKLMDLYYRSVGHNCNLLLNANPDPDGLIPEPDMKRYREFGEEIRRRFGTSVGETSETGAVVELALARPARIDQVVTMEDILEGERVREYVVEGLSSAGWTELSRGQSIGHKKIDRFSPVEVSRVRWRCLKSVAEPRLRKLAVYLAARERPQGMMADAPVAFPVDGPLPAKYPPDVRERHEPAEKDYYIFSSPCRSLAQIDRIQAAMPKGQFTPPPHDWAPLQRTRRLLTEGGGLRLLALGDSIVNDTMRSGWAAKLAEAYPKVQLQTTVYVRGGGGCQHYKELDRIATNVIPRRPNLVFIGGISQRDISSIREVIHQLRAGLPEVEILLATGAFGATDPRDAEALAKASYSGTGAYGQALKGLAAEEGCAYLDMTTPWAEYLRSAGIHPLLFYRDVVHANEYGEQILSKILMAFWSGA